MKTLFAILLLAVVSVAQAQELDLNYVNEFATQGPPLAIAADSEGGIYYTVFSSAGPNLTRAFYVEDSTNSPDTDSHILVSDAAETDVLAGRGFTGIAVDDTGFVYLALEGGSGDASSVRKLTPAPEFAEDEDFGLIFAGVRYNGIDVMEGDVIAVSTFNSVEFWDAVTSAPLHTVSGLESFQRDVAFNPNTDEIYISKNGGDSSNSANRLFNGSVEDLQSYEVENGYIPQGGVNTAFGTNAQLIEYDEVNDLILIPDFSADQPTLAFYDPEDTSAPMMTIDGSESPNGAFTTPADSVVYTDVMGETWVFVTDNPNERILVFSTAEDTQIKGWNLF